MINLNVFSHITIISSLQWFNLIAVLSRLSVPTHTDGVIALGFLTLRYFDFETERLYVAFPDREVRTQIYIMIGQDFNIWEVRKKKKII